MFIVFDTETTGLPKNDKAPLNDFGNWPRLVQLSWQLHDAKGQLVDAQNHLVHPDGFEIPINATMIHHITTEHALKYGEPLEQVLDAFLQAAVKAKYLVGHNVDFDLNVLGCEFFRTRGDNPLDKWLKIDTCTEKTAEFCQFRAGKGGRSKLPSLSEIHKLLFGTDFDSAHNASGDVNATARVFFELMRLHVIDEKDMREDRSFFAAFMAANPDVMQPSEVHILSNLDAEETATDEKEERMEQGDYVPKHFTHLHVHSHYSILDGMSKVPDLVGKCKKNGMYSIALTDHGNMFGIKDLADTVNKENTAVKDSIKVQQAIVDSEMATAKEKAAAGAEIEKLKGQFFKPIFGIETYCAPVSIDKRDGRADRGWHLILLAKNMTGYKSLCKLSSKAYTDGFYYNPRIDHQLLEQNHDGLICTSACLGGEIPQKIMSGDIAGAEASVNWFKSLFGDDFYLELQRHKTDKPGGDTDVYERQKVVNKVLIELARKTNTKLIATNDVHFVEENHGEAHDRLICLATGKGLDDSNRLHYTKQEWLKTPKEMGAIFSDIPEVLENTQEIVDKVEAYSLDSDPIMPEFAIPEDFGTVEEYKKKFSNEALFDEFTRDEHGNVVMDQASAETKIKKLGGYDKLCRIKLEADYLTELTWKGARERYGDNLSDELKDRIIFELHVMKTMGFPGYFLIVQDYIRGAREELGVSVGPGRGSAAGSVVSYCLKITDVDPLKYDLLFERFLNPDRISLPDIDVDFDDEGRGRVLDWITNKYGKDRVAHIITYGTRAAKTAIADVGRVQGVPISVVNMIKGFIPEKMFPDNIKDEEGRSPILNLKNCYKYIPELNELLKGNDENIASMLTYAEELEDTNRQIGIHACGVIIGADDLTNFAPICTVEDKLTKERVVVTQYDGHVIETVGLIKMDFLGLKTLTQIKDALNNIKKTRGIDLDIDHIPLNDADTFALYCVGNTVGTFQFESSGMQKYLRELKPSVFEDLIAMNALYRPGPMDYIPDFIARKNDPSKIKYDIPCMETYLKDTYGITVYQEQVMLLSRLLAKFTRGESDTLRKAMGKKQLNKMMELKDKFMKQGQENGHDAKILEKIWNDWEKFASYAFNKSHATCYSLIAYQTAYLKAHYPAEFMAAVLNSSINEAKEVTLIMEECKRMKINILGPDINESESKFSVNGKGEIRFGLRAIMNVGEATISGIIEERNAGGRFKDFTEFLLRTSTKGINRRVLEAMDAAGCFDTFLNFHRAMIFYMAPYESITFGEKALRMVNAYNERQKSSQIDLFGFGNEGTPEALSLPLPECEPWSTLKELKMEFDSIGFYISSHPLESFHLALKYFANSTIEALNGFLKDQSYEGYTIRIGGQITKSEEFTAKNGNLYGLFTIEDKTGVYQFSLYKEIYLNFKNRLEKGLFVLLKGTLMKQFHKQDQQKKSATPEQTNLQFKITGVNLLDSLLEDTDKKVYFNMDVAALSQEDVNEFVSIIKSNPGKQRYSIHLYNSIDNTSSNMSPMVQSGINAHDVLPLVENLPFVKFDLR